MVTPTLFGRPFSVFHFSIAKAAAGVFTSAAQAGLTLSARPRSSNRYFLWEYIESAVHMTWRKQIMAPTVNGFTGSMRDRGCPLGIVERAAQAERHGWLLWAC